MNKSHFDRWHPKREEMSRLHQDLVLNVGFRTHRLGALHLDAFVDASGSDNWDVLGASDLYVLGMAVVRDSHRWKKWKHEVATTYRGHVHWGDPKAWDHLGGSKARVAHLRRMIELNPWEVGWITVIHRASYSAGIARMEGKEVHPFGGSTLSQLVQPVVQFRYLQEVIRHTCGAHVANQSLRRLIYNNPAEVPGVRDLICREAKKSLGLTPLFVDGQNPGIALADGLAWGLYFHLFKDPSVFPKSGGFPKNVFLEVMSDSPQGYYCESISELENHLALVRARAASGLKPPPSAM